MARLTAGRVGGEPVALLPGLQRHQVQEVPRRLRHVPGEKLCQRVEQFAADLVLVQHGLVLYMEQSAMQQYI
jgi:hypothetical protein